MHWLLVGYMWLYIHRPFEVWPWLGALRVERVYMLVTLGCWFLSANKGWTRNRLNLAFAAFFLSFLVAWILSPYHDAGTLAVDEYWKTVVFYVLVVSCIRDEKKLKFIVTGFLVCMALYMTHSLWEYGNGRYVWRMGTARMVGIDNTHGDPNAFAATVVYALPMTIPFWRTLRTWRDATLLGIYTALTITCVMLTGSRAGFVGLSVGMIVLVTMSRYRWRVGIAVACLAPLVWVTLPEDRQNRYLTLFDSGRGPANAQASAESRKNSSKLQLSFGSSDPCVRSVLVPFP